MAIKEYKQTIRGLPTAWLQSGGKTKPLLLFLHGFPDVPQCWSYQLSHFQSSFQVVAPYIRGAGGSRAGKELGRYTPTAVSLDVLKILQRIDPKGQRDVYVVGHDLGVAHAWKIAGLLQQRCRGLVIINGMTIRQFSRRLTQRPQQMLKSWYMLAMQIPHVPEFFARHFTPSFLTYNYGINGLSLSEKPKVRGLNRSIASTLNQYRAFLRSPRQDDVDERLHCPVLVLWGRSDPYLLPPSRHEFSRDASHLTIRVVRGHHWIHRQQPNEVNRILDDFLAEVH